tara:strand:+ start:1138 stop:1305 length:168 start_codon:yes stop_codon:yes gene_type:complete
MTRKHFKAIAEVVSQIKDLEQRRATALDFVIVLRRENNNFKNQTFLEACGVTDNG